MMEALRVRESPEEARELDKGDIPGDHLGAAGFDSAFFAHLKVKKNSVMFSMRIYFYLIKILLQRNWTYNKATLGANRLEFNRSTADEDKQETTITSGRLKNLRNNATRFAVCSTSKLGETFNIPVTLESNVPHTSKGHKRKRTTGEGSSNPAVSFLKIPTYSKRTKIYISYN